MLGQDLELTHDSHVGTGPDGLLGRGGSNLALVLALILQCGTADDQVVFADGLVPHILVARVAGHGAVEAWR